MEKAGFGWVRLLDEAEDKYREKTASELGAQTLPRGPPAQEAVPGLLPAEELGKRRSSSNAPGQSGDLGWRLRYIFLP